VALPRDTSIVELENKIEELRRQYDLYLSGLRKTEPASLFNEVESQVLKITRQMSGRSTVLQFQIRTLAFKFRSLQAQLKRFMDRRETYIKSKLEESYGNDVEEFGQTIFIDRMVLANPKLISGKVRSMVTSSGNSDKVIPDELAQMLIAKASKVIDRSDVAAVRFTIVKGEKGPKIKGDIIPKKGAAGAS
jgi:hypothetical protein